jgi:hypothetical protein
MRRRHALQIGAAWAMIPLVGCGASAPVPSVAPAAAGKDAIPGHEKAAAGAQEATAGNEAPAASPGEKSDAAGKDAAASSAPEAAAKSPFSRTIARLGRNHGHVLVVGIDDVKAGAEKTYQVAGAAGHPHAVTISADEMKRLLAGELVRTKSTTDRGHAHRVVVRCALPVDPPEWVSACTFTSSGRDEHEVVIPAADVAAQVEKTYDIQGLAGHAHTVTLSAADFQKLNKGGPVTLHSSRDPDDAHLHTCSIERRAPAKT